MPHKLNVIAESRGGLFVSPRKVREDITRLNDKLHLYLTDLWVYQTRPGRPFKYRRGASLVLRIAAHDGIPEACWEVANCQGLRTKEDANKYFAGVCMMMQKDDPEILLRQKDALWHEGRFMHRMQKIHYYPIFQEKESDDTDRDYFADYHRNSGPHSDSRR